jgi:hypothetical protein
MMFTAGCSGKKVRLEGEITRQDSDLKLAGAWVYDPDIAAGDWEPDPNLDSVQAIKSHPGWTQTDSAGHYVLEGVPRHKHFIYFAADDHSPQKVEFKPQGSDDVYIINVGLEHSPIEVQGF